MKIDEAISLLKQYIDYNNPDIPDFYTMEEAIKVIIEALEQEPCGDAISRQAVIDAIEDDARCGVYSHFASYDDAQAFKNYIKDLPSVTAQQRWFPVSERLPEVHKDVLICLSSDQICIGCYNSHRLPFSNNVIGWGADYAHNWCSNDVIAWMPLPEPYLPDINIGNMSEIPTGQISANVELYPGEFDDTLAEEGSDKE